MTERNIDVMGIIVDKLAEGKKFSKALTEVYSKRSVCIPFNDKTFDTPIMGLKLSARTTNALMRAGHRTLKDTIDYCQHNKITNIVNLGKQSGVELFEKILDYSWEHMDTDSRIAFLIDIVEKNNDNIREEIA